MPIAELLTVTQLAAQLQVKPSWVYERTRKGGADSIPHLRLGKYVRFNPASPEFRAWLDARLVQRASESAIKTAA
jgi:predicted DNA-binding transcriptional regulator AlpA